MVIVTLDVGGTHKNNPHCPMRIAQTPSGQWVCVDCGLHIIHTRIRAKGEEELTMDRFEDNQELVLKRAEEGVMTTDEVTPTKSELCHCSKLPASTRTCFVHGCPIDEKK